MDLVNQVVIKYILAFFSAFLLSILINRIIIKIFKVYRWRQVERKYLDNHIIKEGTPSLGGIGIILSSILTLFIYGYRFWEDNKFLAIFIGFIGFGLVGFLDDFAKIKNKKEDGLSGKRRLLFEAIIVLYLLVFMEYNIHDFKTSIISIFNYKLALGALFVPLILLIVVGSANSVNLSDGLDGLSSGLVVCALFPFTLISLSNNEYYLSIFLLSAIGAILGFMIYNLHPAKIFMGDTGSLSLGCLLGTVSIYLDKIYLLPICALIFIFETLSVIIQVLYFKKTKKRIFLMTPFHHHYEKKGVKEYRIVSYFWLFGFILAFISILLGGIM